MAAVSLLVQAPGVCLHNFANLSSGVTVQSLAGEVRRAVEEETGKSVSRLRLVARVGNTKVVNLLDMPESTPLDEIPGLRLPGVTIYATPTVV